MSGYKYKRKEGQRKIRPLLIAAVDGESEANFIHAQFGATHTVMIIEQAKSLTKLVSAVELALQKVVQTPAYGIVLSDIEVTGDTHLKELTRAVDAARKIGVKVYFNAPHFEATMLRHFEPVSINMSKSEIERRLRVASESANLPYKKPESIAYHRDFSRLDRQVQFEKHCAQTHQYLGLPCVCQLLNDVRY